MSVRPPGELAAVGSAACDMRLADLVPRARA